MAGDKPKICVSVVNDDMAAIKAVEPLADFLEIRIDLVGISWTDVVKSLEKPWVACNRRVEEDGSWQGSEAARIDELLAAVELGASIVDIELATPNVATVIEKIKGRADCLLSCHNLKETPPLEKMREIVRSQMAAGADICKLVTTAWSFADNLAVLQLISDFPGTKVVSFAMGALGQISRVLCPLAGAYFTYASVADNQQAAAGQLTAANLKKIYELLRND